MTVVYVTGSEWPVLCAGQPGRVRTWESLETDPQAPAWRLVTEWCKQPRRVRERHGVRRVAIAELLAACPALSRRPWWQPSLFDQEAA